MTKSVCSFVTSRHDEWLAGGNRQRLVTHYHKKAEDSNYMEPKFEKIGSVVRPLPSILFHVNCLSQASYVRIGVLSYLTTCDN